MWIMIKKSNEKHYMKAGGKILFKRTNSCKMEKKCFSV